MGLGMVLDRGPSCSTICKSIAQAHYYYPAHLSLRNPVVVWHYEVTLETFLVHGSLCRGSI